MSVHLSSFAKDIINLMEDGIYISDDKGMTLMVNNAYEALIGLNRSELEGRTVQSLQDEGIFSCVLNPEIVESKKKASVVQELGRKKKIVHLRGFPLFDDQGNVEFVVTFVRDMTTITQLRGQITEQDSIIEQYLGHIESIQGIHRKQSIFSSPKMKELVRMLRRIASTDATVLLLGETGVGKDVFAHMVHETSLRKGKMFLKVDCGSIAENLIESEFFGYVRGAFSGAIAQGKAGYFEIADGGTVFLDEVGDLPILMQSRLLRVLQDQEISPVGSAASKKVNVRIIAATNRDLAASAEDGTFRRDLYYRLNVAKIQIPPLRERAEDIAPLSSYFLNKFGMKYKKHPMEFSMEALNMLGEYSWPGNVRELENTMQTLAITYDGSKIDVADLPRKLVEYDSKNYPKQKIFDNFANKSLKQIMHEQENFVLEYAVKYYGTVSKASNALGIDRSTLYRKLHKK